MKKILLATALLAASGSAYAQYVNVPAGQAPNQTMNQTVFSNNSDPLGLSESSLSPSVTAAGTTQGTATLLVTRVNVITSCPANAGVQLPAVNRYTTIVVLNRSGGSCKLYPTVNATVESAPGTAGAVNAAITLAVGDFTFRPQSATAWLQ